LFKQERVGQYRRNFTFLKFRSMYINNDENVHKEFVHNLISQRHPEIVLSRIMAEGIQDQE